MKNLSILGIHDQMMTSIASDEDISTIILIWMLIVLSLSVLLNLILTGGLEAQPLSKQCLILKIYQDTLKINHGSVCLWSCSTMIWSLVESEEGTYNSHVAGGIAFLDQLVFLILVQNLLFIGILRLLIIKYKVLDPLSNLFEDENVAVWVIRVSILVVSIIIITLIYASSSIPPVYYMIKEGNMENASLESMVILTMDVILLVICAIIHITATFMHKYEGAKIAQRYTHEERTGQMSNRRGTITFKLCFLNANQNDSFEISDGVQNAYAPVAYFTLNSLIVVGGFVGLYYVHIYFKTKQQFWLMIALFFGNQGVIIPAIMIYKYASFRVYLKRQFLAIKDNIPRFKISCGAFRRRDGRVHNLNNEALP